MKPLRPLVTTWLPVLGVALAYALASGFGQLLAFRPPGDVSAVFPASGVALASVLRGGPRYLVGVLLGSWLSNLPSLLSHQPSFAAVLCALGVGAGAALQALAGAWGFRRLTGVSHPFGSLADAACFLLVPSLVACLVNATLGTLFLGVGGFVLRDHLAGTWLRWWLGDSGGVLIAAPFLLAWMPGTPSLPWRDRRAEALLLVALPALVCWAVARTSYPLEYLYLPLLTWAALRFGPRGATALAAAVTACAILTTLQGLGGFQGTSRNESLLLLQAFLGTLGALVLLLLGLLAQKEAAERRLAEANDMLELRVRQRTAELADANQRLHLLATYDGLTGVPNRRYFDQALEVEWRRCARAGLTLAVVLLDIDHFKAFNDTHGHQAGDDGLRRVAGLMASALQRGGEVLARYGGEEFVALMPGADLDEAFEAAERLRRALEAEGVPHAGSPTGTLTLSGGVAACVPGWHDGPAPLLAAADQALYEAKRSGRNRVARAEVPQPR